MQIRDKKLKNVDTYLYTLKVNNLNLERAEYIQYLGVSLDDNLS